MKISNVIRGDIRIAVMIAMVWSALMPVKAVLQGVLTTEFVAAIMIAGTIVIETLPLVTRATTFRSSTFYILLYDLMYMVLVSMSVVFLDDVLMMQIILIGMVPYTVLNRNAGNKFKTLVGDTYPSKIASRLYTRQSVVENRGGIVGLVIVVAAGQMGLEDVHQLWVFVALALIQSSVGWFQYFKYYGELPFSPR